MKILQKIKDRIIKNDLKSRKIQTSGYGLTKQEIEYRKVVNTLRENKVFVITKNDGIYIRLVGNEDDGYCYNEEFIKVKSF